MRTPSQSENHLQAGKGRARVEAGADMERFCALWGVLNVTPDSFSDGGKFLDLDCALSRAESMITEGASVVDVGGESTRPAGKVYGAGHRSVNVSEELGRVMPVVERLASRGVRVSVDTTKAEVADAALAAGAFCINDVSTGRSESLLRAVAAHGAELVLMHSRGRGECEGEVVRYGHLLDELCQELAQARQKAVDCGVLPEKIWFDPGLGFAKSAAQSLEVLRSLDRIVALGQRVLVGASRKSVIAAAVTDSPRWPSPQERLPGSVIAASWAMTQGAHALRVHDVGETQQALRMTWALWGRGGEGD